MAKPIPTEILTYPKWKPYGLGYEPKQQLMP